MTVEVERTTTNIADRTRLRLRFKRVWRARGSRESSGQPTPIESTRGLEDEDKVIPSVGKRKQSGGEVWTDFDETSQREAVAYPKGLDFLD